MNVLESPGHPNKKVRLETKPVGYSGARLVMIWSLGAMNPKKGQVEKPMIGHGCFGTVWVPN